MALSYGVRQLIAMAVTPDHASVVGAVAGVLSRAESLRRHEPSLLVVPAAYVLFFAKIRPDRPGHREHRDRDSSVESDMKRYHLYLTCASGKRLRDMARLVRGREEEGALNLGARCMRRDGPPSRVSSPRSSKRC